MTGARSGWRGSRVRRWVEGLLLLGGAAALLWCAWVVATAHVVQRLARDRLERAAHQRVESTSPQPSSSFAASPEPRQVTPGTPLASLTIPRVGLSAIIMQGSDDSILRVGVGHIETTPLPGERGNIAIAGHRDTFFRPLRDVQVGDDIMLDTPDARIHYRVSWFRVVNPDEIGVIGPTTEAALTLVTCYPFSFIGSAPDRFVVRALLVDDEAPPAFASSPQARPPLAPDR